MENHSVEREPAERHDAEHQAEWNECGEAARSWHELRKQAKEESRHFGISEIADEPLAHRPPRRKLGRLHASLLVAMIASNGCHDRLRAQKHEVRRANDLERCERRLRCLQQASDACALRWSTPSGRLQFPRQWVRPRVVRR